MAAYKFIKLPTAHDRIVSIITQWAQKQHKLTHNGFAICLQALEEAENKAAKLADGKPFAWSDRMADELKQHFNEPLASLTVKALMNV